MARTGSSEIRSSSWTWQHQGSGTAPISPDTASHRSLASTVRSSRCPQVLPEQVFLSLAIHWIYEKSISEYYLRKEYEFMMDLWPY